MAAKRHVTIRHDSPRLVLPYALVSVLNVLLEELDDAPSSSRVQLLAARDSVCRAFRLPLPGSPADPIQLEHELNPDEEIDGI